MVMMCLFFIFSLCFIRFFAGYDSRFQKGTYIKIKNQKLRVLLVDEMSFFERRKRLKKDINKMTISGLVFYIFSAIVLILCVVLLFFVHEIPIEPCKFDTSEFIIQVDNLNEKISVFFIWLLFLSVVWWMVFHLIRYVITIQQRWIRIMTYVVSLFIYLAIIFVASNLIKELALCFM